MARQMVVAPRRADPTVMAPVPRMRPRRPRPNRLAAALIPLLASLTVVGAFALWNAAASLAGGGIAAGKVGVTLGGLTWSCPEQNASGNGSQLATLVLAPGQTLILTHTITLDMAGDNLAVALGVSLPGLPGSTTGTWHLNSGQTQVAPAKGSVGLDRLLLLPKIQGDPDWSVVVTLTMPAGEPVWLDPATGSPPSAPALDLGVMTVRAEQVRCGPGFSTPCPESVVAVG